MNPNLIPNDPDSRFELVIPIDTQTLGGFISDLLKRPQTIRRIIRCTFDLGKADIVNAFHLVHQRVLQQNHGNLVQFTVTIAYSDGSTVTVNSLDDFSSYAEVRPQIARSVHLSWTYLLYFKDSTLPEKQVIELSVSTDLAEEQFIDFSPSFSDYLLSIRRSGVRLRIHHSLRSWGVDIESLLTAHVEGWALKENWLKFNITRHPVITGVISGTLLMIMCVYGLYHFSAVVDSNRLELINTIGSLTDSQKIDWLVQQAIKRTANAREELARTLALGSVLISAAFGFLMMWLAKNPQRSFLALTEASSKQRELELAKRSQGWTYFILSGITATIAGVASRYIFAFLT